MSCRSPAGRRQSSDSADAGTLKDASCRSYGRQPREALGTTLYMKTALIFGITGQDGTFLTRFLLQKSYRVIGVSRNVQRANLNNLKQLDLLDKTELISASMTDLPALRHIITTCHPHEIYDLSGQSSVARSFEKPVETFESITLSNMHLLEILRSVRQPVRFFNAGSSECFGDTGGKPATEKTPFSPQSPYAVAKASTCFLTASYRKAYDLFTCNGFLFNHESFLRPSTFVTRKIVTTACRIAAGSKETLTLGNIDIQRDWGWAPDYVQAMWRMLQQEEPGDYIVATGITCSLKQFIATVFETLSLNWQDHVETNKKFFRPTDLKKVSANPEKAEKELNWKATHTALDVARQMVKAEQKNNLSSAQRENNEN